MAYIIDRRLNSKKKSTVNRQRFLDRYRKHIKKAVADSVSKRSITDLDSGEKISIPRDDVGEPIFSHSTGGKRTIVHPGNKEFVEGDQFQRPKGGGGQGSGGDGEASDSGEGMDDFVFQISQEEMLDFMFEDLELPNLLKRQLIGTETFKYVHGGITTQGTPNNINIVRSLRSANARRIALGGKERRRIKEIKKELLLLEAQEDTDPAIINELKDEMKRLKRRIDRIPFIDDFDIKYNLRVKEPQPTSKAVMFCVMDTSGSMTQDIKDMAKRFYLLLYLFLKRNYKHIEVVFIRHHTSAKEVDEEEFFYSRETGGTVVSSALKLMQNIIEARYPTDQWNIYGAQASDGDNWRDDSSNCYELLSNGILPHCQYFAYVEITERTHQSLWREYEKVVAENPETFAMQQIKTPADIYPVFRDLFSRKQQTVPVT